MFIFTDEVTPKNTLVGAIFSVIAVLMLLHSIQLGSVFMIAVSIVLVGFRVLDTALMLFGMLWNHANTGNIWSRGPK